MDRVDDIHDMPAPTDYQPLFPGQGKPGGMMNLTDNRFADYAGDGVYVINLGWAIELRANDFNNPTDTIVLEPSVLEALNRIANRWKEA